MTYLILGILIFFGTHLFTTFRSREPGKDLKVRMGAGPYMGLYSLAAIAGFVLIVWGFGQARTADGRFLRFVWSCYSLDPTVKANEILYMSNDDGQTWQ